MPSDAQPVKSETEPKSLRLVDWLTIPYVGLFVFGAIAALVLTPIEDGYRATRNAIRRWAGPYPPDV
jgi:hypothetical protein